MDDVIQKITEKIMELQDKNSCWHVLDESDKRYQDLCHYTPIYKSTLWTLILLADMKTDITQNNFSKPLGILTDHLYSKLHGIFTIGKSHFPIPCLNGNMIYLHAYFEYEDFHYIQSVADFFYKYQRFDDGDYKTQKTFPYYSNKSCYGSHTCYWGVVKLLKGLSFIKKEKRSKEMDLLMERCIDFILLHEVCYSSKNPEVFLHTNIKHLTFPNMYQSDFLEILWLLKRENIDTAKMERALHLLQNKMSPEGVWKLEKEIKPLVIPIRSKAIANNLLSERAKEVLSSF